MGVPASNVKLCIAQNVVQLASSGKFWFKNVLGKPDAKLAQYIILLKAFVADQCIISQVCKDWLSGSGLPWCFSDVFQYTESGFSCLVCFFPFSFSVLSDFSCWHYGSKSFFFLNHTRFCDWNQSDRNK